MSPPTNNPEDELRKIHMALYAELDPSIVYEVFQRFQAILASAQKAAELEGAKNLERIIRKSSNPKKDAETYIKRLEAKLSNPSPKEKE